MSKHLRNAKNVQSSRVFTSVYAVNFLYIQIGVKIYNLFHYMLFYQLEYM